LEYISTFAEIELELVPGVEENIQFKLPSELIDSKSKNNVFRT